MNICISVFCFEKRYKIVLDEDKNEFFVNGKKTKMNIEDFRERLLGIVAYWDRKMYKKNIIDAQEYKIIIETDGEVFDFMGCGKYPENYYEFILLCEEAINLCE